MKALEAELTDPAGLHARPAAAFVAAAARFRSDLRIENLTRGGAAVDAKRILAVLTLAAAQGHRVRLTANGVDEAEALATLGRLLTDGAGSGR